MFVPSINLWLLLYSH